METPGADTPLRRAADVLTQPVEDAFVLLEPASGLYLQLNATAGWLLGHLDEPRTPAELARLLEGERGAPADRALADALAFAAEMVRHGVVVPA